MRELTRAEDEIMQILWRLKSAYVKDIVDEMPEPKPAYNTVSTIIRILVKKEFVSYKAHGKTHEYFPAVPKASYSKYYLDNFVTRYFSGSFENMVSFFAKEKNLSTGEIDELLENVKNEIEENED